MAQNRVLDTLQGLQRPKTGFYENCRACNGPKPGFTGIVRSAMAQNRVLRELQGLQSSRIRFWAIATMCNPLKSDSGGFARPAIRSELVGGV